MLTAEKNAIIYKNGRETLRIEAWGKDGIRVRSTIIYDIPEHEWALLPKDSKSRINAKITIENNVGSLKNGKIECRINGNMLSFYNSNGNLLFGEQLNGNSTGNSPSNFPSRDYKPLAGGFFRLRYRLCAYDDEKIYGMGQYQDGLLNKKGATLSLTQRNTQASVPFFISTRGYGFLWNNPAIGSATFGTNRTEWESESTDCLDYWVTADKTPADILKNYEKVTGMPSMMPDYAMGFWQCKLRYRTQEQVLEIAREYHKRGIPLDVIIIDFFHWPHCGDWKLDPRYFPDPAAMVKELKSMGIETMVSIWPTVGYDCESYGEMYEKGYLVYDKRGINIQMLFFGNNAFFDATNPDARKYVWNKVRENYFKNGIKLFWLDVAEPEYTATDFDQYTYSAGPAESTANIYPQVYARAFYDGLRENGVENPISLIRCAWAGSQRYGALAWSGDIGTTLDVMRTQLAAGLSMSVAGIPWWNTDIGGFAGGEQSDPNYRETIIRWFEWGTYCPVMRLHGARHNGPTDIPEGECGSGGPNEIWAYGEEAYEIMKAHVKKRNEMRPYIKSVMKAAHEDGETVMAPLFMRYPNDKKAWNIEDEYMFGGDLLVAPIFELEQRERKVYLPKCETWTEIHTGTKYSGGKEYTVPAPLEYIPVFTRK